MSDIGRARRWNRFVDIRGGKALIVPIDHGLTCGPIEGLSDLRAVRSWLESGALTGTIMHKGMVERLHGAPGIGLMLHLNGAIRFDDEVGAPHGGMVAAKPMLATLGEAVRLGADAVSVHLDMSPASASACLQLLGEVVEEAHGCGMPVLAMLYDKTGAEMEIKRQRHFMRAAIEVGADALKVQPPRELQSLPEMLDGMQMHTPILFAGGKLASEADLLLLARAAVQSGAAGLCAGRNIFQRKDPVECLVRVNQVLNQRGPAGVRSVSDLLEAASQGSLEAVL